MIVNRIISHEFCERHRWFRQNRTVAAHSPRDPRYLSPFYMRNVTQSRRVRTWDCLSPTTSCHSKVKAHGLTWNHTSAGCSNVCSLWLSIEMSLSFDSRFGFTCGIDWIMNSTFPLFVLYSTDTVKVFHSHSVPWHQSNFHFNAPSILSEIEIGVEIPYHKVTSS